MLKSIIFDLEGTFVDTWRLYWEIFDETTTKLNLPRAPKQEFLTLLDQGYSLEEMFFKIYPSMDEKSLLNWLEEMHSLYREREHLVPLMPGVEETLRLLKARGLRMAIFTSMVYPAALLWTWLDRLGIRDFFEVVITGTDVLRKPAPDGIIKCLEKLEVLPYECMIVGDSQADIIAGRGAGVKTVAVTGGVDTKEALLEENPDFLIEELTQLSSLLDCCKE